MSKKKNSFWKRDRVQNDDLYERQETVLLKVAPLYKGKSVFRRVFSVCVALVGAGLVILLYLGLPLSLLFSAFHDWLAQLLAAACLLILVEGIVCFIVLSIAQPVVVQRNVELPITALLPVEFEDTYVLPALSVPVESITEQVTARLISQRMIKK